MYVDEEEWLYLPELNKRQIDENKYSILQNRIMIVGFFTLLLTLNIGGIIVLKHDMHDCEETLYKHLVSTDTKSDTRVVTNTN